MKSRTLRGVALILTLWPLALASSLYAREAMNPDCLPIPMSEPSRTENLTSDREFIRWSYRYFLYLMTSGGDKPVIFGSEYSPVRFPSEGTYIGNEPAFVEFQQAFDSEVPMTALLNLNDRNGMPVYYETRVNKILNEYLGGLTPEKVCSLDGIIPMESTVVRTAWRVATVYAEHADFIDKDYIAIASPDDSYYTRDAWVKLPGRFDSKGRADLQFVKAKMALVGMHMGVIRSSTGSNFIWSTFEHRDNVEDCASAWCELPFCQPCRQDPVVDETVASLCPRFRDEPDERLTHLQQIGTIWRSPGARGNVRGIDYFANISLDAFRQRFQGQSSNKSCLNCHEAGRPADCLPDNPPQPIYQLRFLGHICQNSNVASVSSCDTN